jgi:hypothetical protein
MSAAPTDWTQLYKSMKTQELVAQAWATETKPKLRDVIARTLLEREAKPEDETGDLGSAAWPSGPVAERDEMAGLYPDPADPEFAARIFGKREFYEARAVAAGVAAGDIDPCSSSAAAAVFELTPVQRIVSRFMHPMTPYNGTLLFHGVGVGKTCTAVTVAEQFLEFAPQSKVIVLVPQALKENFKKTVFDVSKLRWDDAANEWTTQQCTGTAYLERLGLMQERDLRKVAYKVEESRRSRYVVTGYQAFANWIERTLAKHMPGAASMPAEARRAAEDEFLRREFSDHLLIIDEAHNLRDAAAEAGDIGAKDATTTGEAAENAGGKALNPWLKRIVLNAEGLRLMLMTATPMYNAAPEIVLLLNYLWMNDVKSDAKILPVNAMFTKAGALKPGAPTRFFEKFARRYVSYMRGENPYTFPLRMRPLDSPERPADEWPEVSATKRAVEFTEGERAAVNALPLVFTEPIPGSPPEQLLRAGTTRAIAAVSAPVLAEEGDVPLPAAEEEAVGGGKISDAMLDQRMQMANISYPNMMYGGAGWDTYFTSAKVSGGKHKLRIFTPKPLEGGPFAVDTVFAGEGLRTHAPKLARVVDSIKKAQGICFAYSRYIKGGALPLAIALERAGFQRRLADGSIAPLLVNAQPPVAPVCALCGERDGAGHGAVGPANHPFRPACYVLLTSEDELSPNFAGLVRQAATWEEDPEWGPLGSRVKAVIGSQVASEGLDLKCVREMHVIDSWYHLNRTEQIIGRAIRYCSHTALRAVEERLGLPLMSMNNTLIYLHAMRVGPGADGSPAFETADMYAYRIAIEKALMVGHVQRLLKKHAWDCNLELEAITFAGLPLRRQVDAQGNERKERNEAGEELAGYSINDRDFTTYCDYQACAHECAKTVARTVEEGLHLDSSTFTVSDARRLILSKQEIVRRLFEDQVMAPETVVQDIFSDLPWEIAEEALMELIDGRRFRLTRPDGVEGFLVKKAGYLVFQPVLVADSDIPLSLRYARAFQLRRRFMDPTLPVLGRAEEYRDAVVAHKKAAGAAGTEGGGGGGGADGQAQEEAAAAVAPGLDPKLLKQWSDWYSFVQTDGAPGAIALPTANRLWAWLLVRYKAIPEMKAVALRWWFDRMTTYEEQRALLELAVSTTDASEPVTALQQVLRPDIFMSKQITAIRIYNPATMAIELFCRSAGGGGWGSCPSNMAAIVEKQLGNKPLSYPDETGPLFGFLSAKGEKLFFKTLDTTKGKKTSTVGAGCINVSNLGEHQPRVRILQAAAREMDPALGPLMLPDDAAEGTEDKSRALMPAHLEDMTLQPLCLYMEVLCRLLDARRLGGRRWFMDAVTAVYAGLKGRK